MKNDDLAEQLIERMLEDANKLRLFAPDCLARFHFIKDHAVFEVTMQMLSNEPSQE